MSDYERRRPEETLVYKLVQEHLETFLAQADARAGEGRELPRYVRKAFREYLRCGILSYGFARVHCPDCGHDGVVGFS